MATKPTTGLVTLHLDDKHPHVRVTAEPLTPEGFAAFGDVVQNPRPGLHPSLFADVAAGAALKLPHDPVVANQGSGIKYQHPTRPRDLYAQAPSGVPAAAVVNLFVCGARTLQSDETGSRVFPVHILERHPFTTQTFVPMSREGCDPVRYFVIVAPSLPASDADAGLPVPSNPSASPSELRSPPKLPGRGFPDLRRLRAFVATGSEAVTYGPGTWHAPMVALGKEGSEVDFFVTQFANGVGVEDCQEVVIAPADRIAVRLAPPAPALWQKKSPRAASKL